MDSRSNRISKRQKMEKEQKKNRAKEKHVHYSQVEKIHRKLLFSHQQMNQLKIENLNVVEKDERQQNSDCVLTSLCNILKF